MRALAAMALMLALLSGCVSHATRVQTVDERPSLSFEGAPRGAKLFVDGLEMGRATDFDGDTKVLRLEPGTHMVEIRHRDALLYSRRVFLDSAHKTITLH